MRIGSIERVLGSVVDVRFTDGAPPAVRSALTTPDRSSWFEVPFVVAEAFTGRAGVRVPLEDTLRGCERILDGAADELDEEDLYMIGALREAA